MVYILYHDSRSEVAKYAITYEGECRSTWPTEIWTNWQGVRGRGRRGGGGGAWQNAEISLTSVLPLLLQLLLGLLLLLLLLLWAMPLPWGNVFSSMLQFNQVLIDLLLLLLVLLLFFSLSFFLVNNLSCTVAQRTKQKLKINNNLQAAIGQQRVP